MCRACSNHGKMKNVYRNFVGEPQGERPLGRPRRRWVYNIKMDFKKNGIGYYGVN
jgi:hypothetical protein